ncbi:MAG: DNA polymerase I, partial [Bacilli bacterium]|nr:DNA polymerase I [Bacilli bacterium]
MKKLILVDGNNIMFRSYYATAATGNLMQNSEGMFTNAIYGFVGAFQQIMKMDFTHILVALDGKGKTFRHEMYPEYKGTRKETPQELVMQFPLMREYLQVAGIPFKEYDRYEADDIIGYSAKHFQTEFDEILIISNDHDLMQLIDGKVSQLISKRGFSEYNVFTPDTVLSEIGIKPEQMTDFKGLIGDASDNIPGVPGVGPKTAVKLLADYNNLETVLNNTKELKGKLKERLEEFADQARFSKQLATIVTEFDNDLSV